MDSDFDYFPPSDLLQPDALLSQLAALVDTSTLAAHDFDVDNRTGFMPPQPPVARLPDEWNAWEVVLEEASQGKLKLGTRDDLTDDEKAMSSRWRARVESLPILPIDNLGKSEVVIRRAHLVLSWILHFYIHTLPSSEPIIIPRSLTLPLLRVSAQLQLPPVLTYGDTVLYNWAFKEPQAVPVPALDNLRSVQTFTGTRDEEEFYLTSARMELRGVEALELMRSTMDEAFVGDDIATKRITTYLLRLSEVLSDLRTLLLAVREGCRPDVFYNEVRPWFKGIDSGDLERKWVFEGLLDTDDETLEEPKELSGPSAGQSSLIHALDIFLGVEEYSHSEQITGHEGTASTSTTTTTTTTLTPIPTSSTPMSSNPAKSAFLNRMQTYMPRHHRNFLNHLRNNPRPLRNIVANGSNAALLEAYNKAVTSLTELRDAHIIIVTLYIIIPARKATENVEKEKKEKGEEVKPLKGTGGTDLARFLKDVRNGTAGALFNSGSTDGL
ncbi:Indoleamine 2,3-dioxygenase [Dendrothele bispora CBS 962.96]|uniref:Indoleamine 2,3-dioxygenase n=1 Tax=Dendrothele bispora (strain CBS 962.96) TaxID=1314807 RepID=A0A4S8M8M7_DENBC|nr:Indoleamine 2,3-dioxygenase [Dendrothele bispora CBS 962.96]